MKFDPQQTKCRRIKLKKKIKIKTKLYTIETNSAL
jgi:hypothetical protein